MPPTSNPWLYLAGLILTFLGGIGLKDIALGVLKRKPRQVVEVASQIDLAKAAELFAANARASAVAAWQQVDEAQQKLVRANRRVDDSVWRLEHAGRYLDALFAKIFERGATIDDVREFVRSSPPPERTRNLNGNGPHKEG